MGKSGMILAAVLIALAATGLVAAQKSGLFATAKARTDRPGATGEGVLLPNGWVLHPAGRQIPTGDLPLAMAVAPDGENLLVTTGGYAPCRVLTIDTENEQVETTQ